MALTSLAVAVGAFAPFVGYAYLTEATYRTTASVIVSSPTGEDPGVDPLEALQRVQAAFRDRSHDAVIQSVDGRHFELVCSAPSAERVVAVCDELALLAVERLPHLLELPAPLRAQTPEERERRRKAEELVALLSVHPELADSQKAREALDPKIASLRAEQAALRAALTPRPPEVSPRQPGTPDPPTPDPAPLRARLSTVEKELQERLAALASLTPKKPSADVRARWQELVKSAATRPASAEPSDSAAPLLTATLAQRATRPSSPTTPDRPLVLLLGSLLGLGGGLIAFFVGSARRARSDEPSFATSEAAESAPPDFSSSPAPSDPPEEAEVPLAPVAAEEAYDDTKLPPPVHSPAPLPPVLPRAPVTGTVVEWPRADELPLREESAVVRQTRIIELNASSPAGREPDEPDELRQSPYPTIPPPPGVRPIEHPTMTHFGSVRPQGAVPQGSGTRPPSRITQTLGSPVPPPEARGGEEPSFHPPGYRAAAPTRRNSTYSYVSTPPHGVPRVTTHPPPISTPPPPDPPPVHPLSRPAPPRPSLRPLSGAPARATRGSNAPLNAKAPPSPRESTAAGPPQAGSRPIVTPHPAPRDWQPAPSLVPDARRALSNEIFPHAVTQCFVIGVSGARRAGEDTGRVAAELALALSETGHPRVLLLEGNLQRPSVQRWMRVDMPLFSGLSEQLDGRVQQNRERGGWSVIACSATLHVLAEGLMSMPELILSRQFEEAVSELRNYYDVIVISGPLISQAAACRAVQDVVDGMVLVCQEGASAEIEEATQLFSKKRLSLVLTA